MRYFKKKLIFFILIISIVGKLSAQQEEANGDIGLTRKEIVQSHKEKLKLTLVIDSIVRGRKSEMVNFQKTLDLRFESDYVQVKDDLYIKIFIARNQEYGKKFYSWRWDYVKKKGTTFHRLGAGNYAPLNFNDPIQPEMVYGQGIGVQGESDYLMFYYHYMLQ